MSLLERLFSPRWFMPTATVIVRTFVRLFYGLRIDGRENVPPGGAVVACNHFSSWDPPVVGVSYPGRLEFMAKKELFEKPLSRAVMRGLRAYPVDRERQDVGAIKESLRRLQANRSIGIFVQGTRSAGDTGALDGAAFLAQRGRVPLVPAAIWREGRSFHVRFGPPLQAEGSGRDDAKALTEAVMEKIDGLIPGGLGRGQGDENEQGNLDQHENEQRNPDQHENERAPA
ncbi:MAG: lysophospholipid acyltransferase family protein [Trueperaceae bacterium]